MPTKRASRSTGSALERDVLYRVIESISYTLELDAVLDAIVDLVESVTHADEVFLYTTHHTTIQLAAAAHQKASTLSSIHLDMGQGITGWVAEHRQAVAISEHAYADKRFVVFPQLRADRYEAFASFPLVYRSTLVGVLNIQFKKAHQWKSQELKLMQMIATVTAGAIDHARLFSETESLQEALASRKQIEKAKGLLMKAQHLNEHDAYVWMKKRAMDTRKSMKEVAEALLISFGG